MAATYPTTEVQKQPSGILASCSNEIVATVTNDSTTTARLDFKAFMCGVAKNATGAAITITWYGANHLKGAVYALYDQDAVAVTQTIANNTIQELHSALAGVPILVPVGSVASASINFVFKR